MTSTPHILFQRVWHRKWLVLSISLLAVLAAAVVSFNEQTTYTSKAALMVVSQTRAPEQDSILTVGYVNFFNDPQYQTRLRGQAGVPEDVKLVAESVAASPMLYISAISTNSAEVESAAGRIAEAFQNEINDRMQAKRDAAIASVRKPFDDIRSASGVIPEQALIQMQDRISTINADNTNELQMLRRDSTVEVGSPSTYLVIAVSLVGGLVIGALVALALGAYSRRLQNEHDVSLKAGVQTIATVPNHSPAGRNYQRTLSIQRLTNLIALSVPRPGVVAVASTRRSGSAAELARALAAQRASQDVRTLVVDATQPAADRVDVGHSPPAGLIADHDVVALDDVLSSAGKLDPERIKGALDELEGTVDLIVVVVPPLFDDIAGQAICAAADRTVIVVEQGVSRSDHVAETARLVADVKGRVLGAVIVTSGGPVWRSNRRASAASRRESEHERVGARTDHGDNVHVEVAGDEFFEDAKPEPDPAVQSCQAHRVGGTPEGVMVLDPAADLSAPDDTTGAWRGKAAVPAGPDSTGAADAVTEVQDSNGSLSNGSSTMGSSTNGAATNATAANGKPTDRADDGSNFKPSPSPRPVGATKGPEARAN